MNIHENSLELNYNMFLHLCQGVNEAWLKFLFEYVRKSGQL